MRLSHPSRGLFAVLVLVQSRVVLSDGFTPEDAELDLIGGETELRGAWTREHQTAANVSKLVRLLVAERSRLLRRFARRSWGSLALLSD